MRVIELAPIPKQEVPDVRLPLASLRPFARPTEVFVRFEDSAFPFQRPDLESSEVRAREFDPPNRDLRGLGSSESCQSFPGERIGLSADGPDAEPHPLVRKQHAITRHARPRAKF